MSQWTHIAGCIRIDSLGELLGEDTKKQLEIAFGNTCEYNDERVVWDTCNVPCGSEGSLQYAIQKTGRENELAWGIVYIWGDLRDYDGAQEIFEWLANSCEGFMIRSCTVKIDVEGVGSFIVHDSWDDEKAKTILVMNALKNKEDGGE